VRAGKKIPVPGTGRNRYQLLDVTDLVDAVWLAAHAEGPGDDYNVGASRFGTVAEDLGALCAHAATGARVRPVPAWPAKAALRALERARLSPLYRWVYETCDHDSVLDTSKIEHALGFRAKSSNVEVLCATYDWYLREGVARSLHTGGTGHRVAWEQGALRLVRWLS
jgi:nucleoside-diphosphate-sugar epimerase